MTTESSTQSTDALQILQAVAPIVERVANERAATELVNMTKELINRGLINHAAKELLLKRAAELRPLQSWSQPVVRVYLGDKDITHSATATALREA